MRTGIPKLAGAIGLAVGLVIIGGSVIGGIALANDRSHDPVPAATDAPGTTGHGDDANDDQDADEDATETPEANDADDAEHGAPAATSSHHDDGPGDDGHGSDGPGDD